MKIRVWALALLACLLWSGAALAEQTQGGLYLMTNDPEDNQIGYYLRGDGGELTFQDSYDTGGQGSGVTEFSFSDPLGSQSSLILSPDNQWLFCVNAGSNEISVFRAGPEPVLVDRVESGGSYPVSLAFSRGLLYVLNAGGEANITGFWMDRSGILSRIISSTRSLDLEFDDDPPDVATTPAKIGFSPGGDYLIVTLKQGRENGEASEILIYEMGRDDLPSAQPRTVVSPADKAFGFAFDGWGRMVVAETAGSVSSYELGGSDGLTVITSALDNTEGETSWIVRNGPTGGFLYSANAASGTITGYASDEEGALSLLNRSGVTAEVGRSGTCYPSCLAASSDGRYLYVLNRATRQKEIESAVAVFAVAADGSLDYLSRIEDLATGAQGLAAY